MNLQPVSTLGQCPPEICKKIFTYACNDGGFTGRSLSLVSRYIHNVSEDVKYHSLAICGMQQILKCNDVLENKPPHLRRIRHLFISGGTQVKPGQTRADITEYKYGKKTNYDDGCYAFFNILIMAAPTLITFYLSSIDARPTILIPVPMKMLEEFTFFNEFQLGSPSTGPPEVDFPSLKRLRFVGFSNMTPALFHEVYTRAPRITHLYFQTERSGDELLEHLSSFFGLQATRSTPLFNQFPEEFLRQIVEVRVEAPNKKRSFQAMQYERQIQRVTALEPRIKFTTVPEPYKIPFCYAYLDWLRDSTREWNFPVPHRFID
ncbi:hypothetical protein AN958_00531 [Leucoagaricus sp. SymC.cos]|nr:hypothetical protein AN958_00531 [Leucoagaricus sp. SymC.cos]